jgi:hypothetical protein
MPTEIRAAHQGELEALVHSPVPTAAFAAVHAITDLPGARAALETVVGDDSAHPELRRRAQQALDHIREP